MACDLFRGKLLCIILFYLVSSVQAEPVKFLRYPHIHQGKIAFSYHDDIWIADENGANSRRLTAHIARDVFPRFSPDGKWIAFTSNRLGNNDVWVIPVDGGAPRQLTFHTTNDNVLYWTPDGRSVIFATSRGAHAFFSPLYTVSVDGGLPMPMAMDQGQSGMISQDGTKIAFNRSRFTYWRKGYKGNNNTDIYVQDLRTREITKLTDIDPKQFRSFRQDAHPMWGADGMIYFLSERDGIFNIWRISPRGGSPAQVTFHKKDGVQYPSISPDGKTLSYENEFELWKASIPDGKPTRISVDMAFDPKVNLIEYLQAESKADGFFPSETGDYMAVDFHGEVFIVPTEEGIGQTTQVTSSPWREMYAQFSPEGKYLAYISDESLEEEIWLYDVEKRTKRKLTTHESMKSRRRSRSPSTFIWSQDSKQLALAAANKLFTIDVQTGGVNELGYHEAGGYRLDQFAPDGKWLLLTMQDDTQISDVHLFDIAAGSYFNLTQSHYRDTAGILTPDAKHLIFSSNRDQRTNHLFMVSLAKMTENPNDPLVKERLKRKTKTEGTADSAPPSISLDMEGIKRRAIQITSGNDAVGRFFLSKDGRTIYYASNDEKGPGLFSIGLDGANKKKIAEGNFSSMIPTEDRKSVFYAQNRSISKLQLSKGKTQKLSFDFTVAVDKRGEWEQMFEECWRVMKYIFYDPEMHGTDWAAMRKQYKPLLQYVGDNQDLYDLTNEMIGELNASHTGVRGPTRAMPTTYTTRFLGFELEPAGEYYRISHIHRDGPADQEWLDINVGDHVFAIDGKEVKAGDNYWKLLNHTVNDFVTVKIGSEPDGNGKGVRECRIETVTSLRNIKYEEWVEKNRKYVEQLTGGEIAYMHIRSMNQTSLRRVEDELNKYWLKKGVVVDIRYNGGGNIDEPLLDILERRPYGYVNNRWGARTWGRRHRQTIAGPKVMLINMRSFSDSEMTPSGFRVLNLGRIVGNPTGAGVIWTGSYTLINGGRIRTPGSLAVSYDPSKESNYGINLENYGVPPDVLVKNTPQDELDGFDRELKAAVEEVQRMLKNGRWQHEDLK